MWDLTTGRWACPLWNLKKNIGKADAHSGVNVDRSYSRIDGLLHPWVKCIVEMLI